MKQFLVSLMLVLIAVAQVSTVNAQQRPTKDTILFSVGSTPVTTSEFRYIYGKTNGEKATYTKKSLEEYLDLYIKFKLKVQKSKDLQLDTIPNLKRELEGYRRQLASTYLLDKEVLNDLVDEAYERLQEDVSISHIFIASSGDDAKDRKRAEQIKERIIRGKQTFEEAAKEFSEDKPTATEGGFLGYITAFSLKSFYEIENAAYNMAPGDVSEPIRSKYGFHIVKVNDKRPARGEVETAHIMVQVKNKDDEARVQQLIRKIHKELEGGADFAATAKKYSEDRSTAPKGGNLGVIKINQYEPAFENAVFGLKNDGDFSLPFRSSVGWHIVKRVRKIPLLPLDEMRRGLRARIQRDGRFEVVQQRFVERLKKENNFKLYQAAIDTFRNNLDATFLTYQWKYNQGLAAPIFAINSQTTKMGQLVQFLTKSGNVRVRQAKGKQPQVVFDELLNDYISQQLIRYEETQLPTKYPEFKALLREYEEGILLFEATNMLVWSKAAQDSVGLRNYYEKNKKKYLWDERVEVTTYQMPNEYPTKLKEARKLAKRKSSDVVLAKINDDNKVILTSTTKIYEKEQNADVDAMKWKKGVVSDNIFKGDAVSFLKIEQVVKPTPKSFEDARGYVIADYQIYLEEQWVKELEAEYKVKINEDALKALVK